MKYKNQNDSPGRSDQELSQNKVATETTNRTNNDQEYKPETTELNALKKEIDTLTGRIDALSFTLEKLVKGDS